MNDTIKALTESVHGRVITASDPDYDDARAVYNAMHDRRPHAVVQCTDSADVMAVIAAARDTGVDLAIRGGGHSVPGFGTVDDGLVIDLSPMTGVQVDPAKKVVRVGGGATWGDVDHATYPFGLAAPGGVVSTTGVAGLTLGGGIGYLTRSVGLSIDNLLSADVVLADGRQVTASDYQNEDLFWALRGGGGNFGVVTSFEFQLHEVGDVVGGPLFYDFDDATAVLECYRSYIKEAPEQLGCFFGWQIAPPLPFIPEDRVGDLFCVLVTCWNGPHEEAEQVLRPLRDVAEVQAELVEVMPFPALQGAFDDFVPKGMQNYWKADFATELTDEAIAAHVEHGKRTPNASSSMHLHPINGAAQRVGGDETAFGHRDKSFAPVIVGIWPDPADNEANTMWVRDYYAAIHPHSGSVGGYINFMSGDDDHRAAENYGANYERLSAVKAIYDPDNVFHVNQNIAPTKREVVVMTGLTATQGTSERLVGPDESLLDAARAIAPIVRAHSEEAERERRLSHPVLDALRESGLLRMTTPRSLGGLETDPVTRALVVEEIGRHDSAAAWTLENPLDWAFLCCRLPDEGAEEIYSRGADILIAGQFGRPLKATSTDGGYRISGRAPFVSNCYDADWILSMVVVDEDESAGEEPEMRMVYFPSEQCEIIDTWDVMGMRGTGSNDISMTDVYVPKSRTFPFVPDFEPGSHYRGPLYRLPVPGVAATGIPTPMLGVARRALDEVTELARTKTPVASSGLLKERASAQVQLGRAEAILRSGRLLLLDTLSEAWRRCIAGETHSLEQKADLLLAMAHAMSSAVQAVELACSIAGTTAFRASSPLERCFRDVQTMRHHVWASEQRYGTFGQVCLGVPPDFPVVAF